MQTAKNTGNLLLLPEVATYTRASISTVRYWVATGKLASVKPGRRRMVLQSDLDAFIAAARFQGANLANDL